MHFPLFDPGPTSEVQTPQRNHVRSRTPRVCQRCRYFFIPECSGPTIHLRNDQKFQAARACLRNWSQEVCDCHPQHYLVRSRSQPPAANWPDICPDRSYGVGLLKQLYEEERTGTSNLIAYIVVEGHP